MTNRIANRKEEHELAYPDLSQEQQNANRILLAIEEFLLEDAERQLDDLMDEERILRSFEDTQKVKFGGTLADFFVGAFE